MIYAPVYIVFSNDNRCLGVFWSEKIAIIVAKRFNASIIKQEILEHNPFPSV